MMVAIVDNGGAGVDLILEILDRNKYNYLVTKSELKLMNAEKIIFFDSGNAQDSMKKLYLSNLATMLRVTKKPFLGISLGMQLLSEKFENGNICCLGVFPISCKKYDETKVIISQAERNNIKIIKESPLLAGVPDNSQFLFNSSFYIPVCEYTIATSFYNVPFSASINKNNFYGVQFIPEKNHKGWEIILKNFVEKC